MKSRDRGHVTKYSIILFGELSSDWADYQTTRGCRLSYVV